MRCEELMKREVVCADPNDTVQSAAVKMREEGIGFLPVCASGREVLGTLTDRDIALRVCAEDRTASQTTVADVMTGEVIACRASDDLSKAEALMRANQKSRILVLDEQERLVGVISLSDIAELAPEEAAETLREVSEREAHP